MNTSMLNNTTARAGAQTAVTATDTVIRNTCMLLSMTLLFSALTAGVAMAVSAMFVLLMAGLILYETSNIIHGGETN